MSKKEHVEMVAKALTFLTEEELKRNYKKNNKWEIESTRTSINGLISSLSFFFENKTQDIYINSVEHLVRFNVPTLKSIDLSELYDTPLDFVIALRNGIISYLMEKETSESLKDFSSDMSLEPPLT